MKRASARSGPRLVVNALALRPGSNAARTYLENVLAHLPAAWDGDVLALMRSDVRPPTGVERVAVKGIGSGIGRAARELTHVPRLLEGVRPDVVLSPNESLPRAVRAPLVVVAQNLLWHCPAGGPLPAGPYGARLRSQLQARFYRRQMPRAYARADSVVCVSQHAANVLAARAGLDPAKVAVVPCGADRLAVEAHEPQSRLLLCVGAIAHYKRLDVAVEALGRLEASYELALVGEIWPGQEAPLREAVERAGLRDRVKLVGAVDDETLARLYARAHVLLALSACESFGIPVVEGMRAGVPVVGADEPWLAEIGGDAVVRVPPTPAAVAAAVTALESEWPARSAASRATGSRYRWADTAAGLAAAAAAVLR